MAKQILIDSSFGMVRTALSENGELVDYYEESPDQGGRNKGNIYRGLVKRVDAPIQAAFVKFSNGRDGFLPLRDASSGKTPKPGDNVLVQVVKDEVGDKGAALTAKLSFSGRYLVYIPERDGEGGISSKITDEERAALKKVLGDLKIPDGASVILRTAASEKSVEALQEDLDKLIAAHREIAEKFDAGGEPGLLFREAPPALRYLREYYTDDVARIRVNTHESYDECRQFFEQYDPESAHKLELSHDGALLFQRAGLEAEIEKLSSRRVGLKSGANIVIDQAEALVAIDVNSAKASGRGEEGKGGGKERKGKRGRDRRGGDLEETVFAVNKEAAAEIGRQLRLRDLGGIIIVDFIDMESDKHNRQVEEAMRRALAGDKAKVKVYDISPLGTMQISRQRLRKAGHQFTRLGCEACQGRGWHPSASAAALSAMRKLEERLQGKKPGTVLTVSVPYPVANKMMNEFRGHLAAMEKRTGCPVRVLATGAASGDPVIAVLGGGEGAPRNGEAPAAREGEHRNGHGQREAEHRNGQAQGHREGEHRHGPAEGRERNERGRDGRGRDGRGRDGEPRDQERGRDGRGRDGNREARRDGQAQGGDRQGRRDGRDGRRPDGLRDESRNTAPAEATAMAETEAAIGAELAAQAQSGPEARGPRPEGREERGGRRRRGRGRGRDRDRGPREGGPDRHPEQRMGPDSAGAPREGMERPRQAEEPREFRAPEPLADVPHKYEEPAREQPTAAPGYGRSEPAAPVAVALPAEGDAITPRVARARPRKEPRADSGAATKPAAKGRKGPQPARPGTGRPAAEPKSKPAKAPQATRAAAAPAEAAKAKKPARPRAAKAKGKA